MFIRSSPRPKAPDAEAGLPSGKYPRVKTHIPIVSYEMIMLVLKYNNNNNNNNNNILILSSA